MQKVLIQIQNKEPQEALQKVTDSFNKHEDKQNRIVVKHGQTVRIIPLFDINCLEAYGDYIKIHCAEGIFLKKKTMSFYENNLDPNQFIRVHRSFMVNSSQIQKIDAADFVLLKSGQKVPISKSGYARLKSALGI